MKATKVRKQALVLLTVLIILTNGCIAIPPLINVTHRGSEQNTEKRLDSIDRRLSNLEQKLDE